LLERPSASGHEGLCSVPISGGHFLLFGFSSVGIWQRRMRRVAPTANWRTTPSTGCPKQEACDDEGMAALPFAVFISPVVRDDPGFEDELISLARMASDGLRNFSDRDEPQTRNKLARAVLLGLARRVASPETEAGEREVALGS